MAEEEKNNGIVLDGYDYSNPLRIEYDRDLSGIPFWTSDVYSFELPLQDNFTKLKTITVKARLALLLDERSATDNKTYVKPRLQLFTDTKYKASNGVDYVLRLDNPLVNAENTTISRYVINYNNNEKDKEMFHHNYFDSGSFYTPTYWDNVGYSIDYYNRFIPEEYRDRPLERYGIQHTKDGGFGGLKLEFETLAEHKYNVRAWDNSSGGVYRNISTITLPNFEWKYVINDVDFVKYMPQTAQLPANEKDNQVSVRFGVRLPKAQNLDKKHKPEYFLKLDIANYFQSTIDESKNTNTPLTQSYTNVLNEVKLKDDFSLKFLDNLVYTNALLTATARPNSNRRSFYFKQKKIFKALFSSPKDLYIPCKLTLTTKLDTNIYEYKVFDTDLNYVNELLIKKDTKKTEIVGKSGNNGRFYRFKMPKVKLKLVYKKPFYVDGVKVSGESYIQLEYLEDGDVSGILDDSTFNLDLVDSNGNSKRTLEADFGDDKIYLTDSQATLLKDGELFPETSFKGDYGSLTLDNVIDTNSNGDWDINIDNGSDSDNQNHYLEEITFNNKTLGIYDFNNSSKNVTGDNTKLIQNKSKLQVNIPIDFFKIPEGNGITELTIEYQGSINNIRFDSTKELVTQFNFLVPNFGSNLVTLTIRDKENVVKTYKQTFNVIRYLEPNASISIEYVDVDKNIMNIQMNAVISQFLNKNKLNELKFRYKMSKKTTWSNYYIDSLTNDYLDYDTKLVYEANKVEIKDSNSFLDYTFDFEVIVKDLFNVETKISINNLGLGVPLTFYDERLNSTGFNCFPAKNNTATFKHISFDNQQTEIYSENDVLIISSQLKVEGINILDKIADLEQKILELQSK